MKRLARQMRAAGAYSGAYVVERERREAATGLPLAPADTPRILASNTKLFTTAAALARFGPWGTLGTEVLGERRARRRRRVRAASLYLRGGGDPTFGSRTLRQRSLRRRGNRRRTSPTLLEDTGIERVTGPGATATSPRFDSLRGGPDSGYGVSPWVGPLSALSYNRGLVHRERARLPGRTRRRSRRRRLDDALEARGVTDPAEAAQPAARRPSAARPGKRRLTADGAADPAHEQAVGQLLRRDCC